MRPVIRGERPQNNDRQVQFTDYRQARGELISRMGEYCSYCEMRQNSSLAVEHVQPKRPSGVTIDDPHRALDWDNFLLACNNCNATKGNKDVNLDDYLWPHLDNTFRAVHYSEGGVVAPSKRLDSGIHQKALNTIKLLGLDKTPNDKKASDRRWLNRKEAWDIAQESKSDLAESDTPQMRRQIVRTATGRGYWSIWMTVFQDDADMLRRFIEAFPGTCQTCFDSDDNYKPVHRKGGRC